MRMHGDEKLSPIDNIVELARKIIDECPSCTSKASEIVMWAYQVRELRPSRDEIEALVDSTCKAFLPEKQRALLIDGLRALVRFAE